MTVTPEADHARYRRPPQSSYLRVLGVLCVELNPRDEDLQRSRSRATSSARDGLMVAVASALEVRADEENNLDRNVHCHHRSCDRSSYSADTHATKRQCQPRAERCRHWMLEACADEFHRHDSRDARKRGHVCARQCDGNTCWNDCGVEHTGRGRHVGDQYVFGDSNVPADCQFECARTARREATGTDGNARAGEREPNRQRAGRRARAAREVRQDRGGILLRVIGAARLSPWSVWR